MDYASLTDDELERLFYQTRDYPVRLGLKKLFNIPSDKLEAEIEKIHEGLTLLTPNVARWAFDNDNWRPAQTMTTLVACGRLAKYTDAVGEQLSKRMYCSPYIYALARIATPDVVPYLEEYLIENMTIEQAKSSFIWDLHVDIALAALKWLDENHNIKYDRSFDDQWEEFRAAVLSKYNHRPEDRTLVKKRWNLDRTRTYFDKNMMFLAIHFDE